MTNEKILMVGALFIVFTILIGLFVLEFYTENDIFNETINGMVIGLSFGWIGAWVTFHTTSDDNKN